MAANQEVRHSFPHRDFKLREGDVKTPVRSRSPCFTQSLVCQKCAVRFGPVCAKVRRFNTGAKRFRAGLVGGNLLICRSESRKAAFRVQPTLNQ